MNLQENIQRIKEVMGILNEQNSNEVQNQLNWLRSYVQSPQYLERLKKEFPGKDQKFIENERNVRLNNLKDAEYRTHFVKSIGKEPGYISGMAIPKKWEGKYYDYKTKQWLPRDSKNQKGYNLPGHVYMEKDYDPKNWKPSSGYETIPTHEYGHLVDDGGFRIPQSTKDKIFKYTKQSDYDKNYKSGNMEFSYATTPTEFINRLQAIRYLLNKEKIYNPSTNKFTDKDYMNMINNPTLKNNTHFQDVFDSLKGNEDEKKKNFIDLMNTVAYQPNNNSQTA
jgi:hypothetical protein